MKKIISLGLSCAFCMAASIKDVEFSGLTYLSKESAMQISGLKIGEEINPDKLNTAILKLYEQNYFNDIVLNEDKGIIKISLKEKPSITRIDIKGIATNDRKQIDSILEIKKGFLYDENSAKESANRIKNYYEARGYFDTIVKFESKELNSQTIELIFTVNRGENIIIEKVLLSGNKKLNYSDIEPTIANKKREFMGWMWGRNDGKLKIFDLSNDSARISDVYMSKGYLDAKVSPPFLKTYMDTYKAELSYFIDEGKAYKIREISIENPVFDQEANSKKVRQLASKSGKIFNINKVRQDISSIETDTANLGYAFATVYPDIQKNPQTSEVDLIFKVVPGEKVFIRNVIISGNTRTADKIVRRELYLTEGNLYHRDELSESRNALRRTSYFEDVQIQEQRVDNTHIDLVVEIKEASTGAISGGIGYGSSDGLLLNASVSDTNIFGSGIKSSVNLDKSDDSLSGRLSLLNPRLRDSYYSLGGTIYSNEFEWDNYNEKNYGFDVTLGRSFARYFSASLTYNLENSNIFYLSPTLIRSGYQLGKTIKSSLTPAISFNNTDDFYLPRKGFIASTALEFAGLGGDQDFVSSRTSFNFYQGLADYIGFDLIYRYKANFYKVWDRGYLPINQKFYLGGIRSIRGFESRTVSPRNIFGDETGGTIAFNNSVELSFPLIDRIRLRGALFFDYGLIGEKKITEINRYSTGVALEWITPIGPLQLVFARPLNNKAGDDTNSFEFMLGTRF